VPWVSQRSENGNAEKGEQRGDKGKSEKKALLSERIKLGTRMGTGHANIAHLRIRGDAVVVPTQKRGGDEKKRLRVPEEKNYCRKLFVQRRVGWTAKQMGFL